MTKIKDYSYGVIPITKVEGKLHFLLIKHNEGHWSFPKGHKEGDETDMETALRELHEETGISQCKIDDSKTFLEKYVWNREGTIIDKTVKFFVGYVDTKDVNIRLNEIGDFKWVDADEALDLLTYPETVELFREVIKYLR